MHLFRPIGPATSCTNEHYCRSTSDGSGGDGWHPDSSRHGTSTGVASATRPTTSGLAEVIIVIWCSAMRQWLPPSCLYVTEFAVKIFWNVQWYLFFSRMADPVTPAEAMERMHQENLIADISDLIQRQLVTSALEGQIRGRLERQMTVGVFSCFPIQQLSRWETRRQKYLAKHRSNSSTDGRWRCLLTAPSLGNIRLNSRCLHSLSSTLKLKVKDSPYLDEN